MSLAVYPAIDIRGGRCVRLVQGDYARETVFGDDPVEMALRWVTEGADRLHLVDLDGAKAGKPANGEAVRRICAAVDVPVQLGGGLRTGDDLAAAFDAGVRWAVLGSKALSDPEFLRESASRHPGRLVLGLDARGGRVATEGWLETSATLAADLARRVEDAPLFSVVFTDIARDGTLGGPNLDALREIVVATRLPVIASGGVARSSDLDAIGATGAFGVIVGRALYDGAVTLAELLARTGLQPPPGPAKIEA